VNNDRLEARRKAWDDGAWVREGLLAHAEKKRASKVAAE
jgi:ring-1,2-phenylacetyl-CoA epoxidase subunit PaaA